MPARSSTIGHSEWKVMEYILDHHPVSAREVATHMAETRGLARTSVLTVMDRLREKGHLRRWRKGRIWVYAPKLEKEDLLRQSVKEFVEARLQGALSPFVAYLSQEAEVTDEQLAELRDLVESLEKKQRTAGKGRRQ